MRAVPRHPALDQPAPNDHPRASDTSSTMHRRHAIPLLIVPQHVQYLTHKVYRGRQRPIVDGVVVVFDVFGVDAQHGTARLEVRGVWEELVWFCEVDEGADAREEERVEFLFRLFARDVRRGERAVGKLAGDEERGGPVGVGDRARFVAEEEAGGGVFGRGGFGGALGGEGLWAEDGSRGTAFAYDAHCEVSVY